MDTGWLQVFLWIHKLPGWRFRSFVAYPRHFLFTSQIQKLQQKNFICLLYSLVLCIFQPLLTFSYGCWCAFWKTFFYLFTHGRGWKILDSGRYGIHFCPFPKCLALPYWASPRLHSLRRHNGYTLLQVTMKNMRKAPYIIDNHFRFYKGLTHLECLEKGTIGRFCWQHVFRSICCAFRVYTSFWQHAWKAS